MMERQQVRVGDLEFDLRVWGPRDGRPVVLLHGFPETGHSWEGVAAALAADGFRLIAPDQRGYSPGARPAEVREYRVDLLAGDVLGILDAFEIDSAHVVGHDWGAIVAWELAAKHPDRVRSLVAVSVPHPAAMVWALKNDPAQKRKSAYIAFFRKRRVPERVLLAFGGAALKLLYGRHVDRESKRAYLAVLREPGALTAALNWYRAMSRGFGELPAVRVPTTYLWSTKDVALGETAARRCGHHVEGDYEFEVLDGISHWIPEEAPEAVAAAVRKRVG
ncbi:alpha/beta hydrolase [Salinibacterium sp. SYSU T00001]|uniref:alpha/beta fold hydrolase n=1 Tax=Homoserinimonas sedimenticola TaxID=2986805 RepID=UPI0022365234|nr:alpha/beta hydrolase [Salinibacterium sedimenticola]MCW4385576.1 alpha/beta hydrolase [Salinibacterium sedimenticola]